MFCSCLTIVCSRRAPRKDEQVRKRGCEDGQILLVLAYAIVVIGLGFTGFMGFYLGIR